MAAIEQGQWPQAEQLMARAVAVSPVNVEARRHYAETLLQRGASAEALVQLEEAMRLSSQDASLAVRSGEIYLATGELDAAQRLADKALRIDSSSASAWALRGRINAARGDTRGALADTQHALGLRPQDRRLIYEIAQLYKTLNRPDRALVCFQALAETYTAGEEPREVLVDQAQMLTAVARYGDAAAMYEQALRRGATSPELHFHVAQCYLDAGQSRKAAHAAQEGLALAPEDPRGKELMARVAAGAGDGRVRR